MTRLVALMVCAVSLGAAAQLPDYVPADGLVGWWPLDGNASDESGHGYDGEIISAENQTNRFGMEVRALNFSSCSNEAVNLPDMPVFPSFSISFWARTWGYDSDSWVYGDWAPDGGVGVVVRGDNKLYVHVDNGGVGGNGYSISNYNFVDGDWTHVVVQRTNGNISFWINGQLISTVIDTSEDPSDRIGPARIGSSSLNSQPFVGDIDDFGFWNRPLSPLEIEGLYVSTPDGCLDPVACNYFANAEFDDGSCDYSCCPGPGCCDFGMFWDWELGMCQITNPSDSNFDGCVQLNDLLDLLSAYGDCGDEESAWQCGDPLEYQGYDYESVQIGEQCWFAENLRAESYRNGESLGSTLVAWLSSTEEGQTVIYGADSEIACQDFSPDIPVCDSLETTFLEFGLLYNNHAISDIRGVCPLNWHVSTDEDWMILESFLGIPEEELAETGFRGSNQGQMIKTTYGWKGGGSGSDAVGFHGKPAGGFSPEFPNFNNAGSDANWWAPSDVNPLMRRNLNDYTSGIRRVDIIENAGISIRCIKD